VARRRKLTSWLVTGVVGLLAAAFVALAGTGGWLYWNRVELRGEQATRAQLGPLAKDQVPKILGYDYQTVETSLTAAYSFLTPDFRREYEERTNKDIIPEARKQHLVSQVNVVGVGVMDAHRNSGTVMVYINQTYLAKDRDPLYSGVRIRVNYERVKGQWLISDIKPI
jgi:Mce-associated membrane protein